jgi:hypothetical protein
VINKWRKKLKLTSSTVDLSAGLCEFSIVYYWALSDISKPRRKNKQPTRIPVEPIARMDMPVSGSFAPEAANGLNRVSSQAETI